ncbi:MAG: MFS transporter [Variovorax sp.]|nr:MAG: MFS transporter [Variovorax sp.]
MTRPTPPITALSPLRNRSFAVLWWAWLVGNSCLWMSDVAAAWLMTTISDSKAMVALVQTATALPAFMLALPGGALADLVDRRRWFLVSHLWMAGTAGLLTLTAFTGSLSPPVLLGLVFCGGTGFAMRWPVFSALVPEVVARPELPQALALHAVAVNASRVIGPIAAGGLLAAWGSSWVFALSTALWLVCALMVWRWRHAAPLRTREKGRLLHAMRAGLRYAWRSAPMRSAMAHGWLLFVAVAGLMGLLPLLARLLGNGSAAVYTALFACLGGGAIVAALSLQRLRAHTEPQRLVSTGLVILALTIVAVAVAPNTWLAAPALSVWGGAWLTVGNTLSVRAQLALPDRLRARGMAIFLMAVMAGSASGAAAFGAIAEQIGVRPALLALATFTLGLCGWMRSRWPIRPRAIQP